jgi:selenide,water dikinase
MWSGVRQSALMDAPSKPQVPTASPEASPLAALRLTQTVQKGGCAAKIAASELRRILKRVEFPPRPPELLVDGRLFDDASVQQLTDELALVNTVDFFTPIVDSPRMFGAIAATNALSDIYAMGAKPISALGILAFPISTLPESALIEVLQGACDQLRRAGASLSGGHSIDDDTLKFGLAVSGLVHPQEIWKNSGAQPGDVLLLTKALGTGTLSAALKRSALTEEDMRPALESMCRLNDAVSPLQARGLRSAIHAATDITGFGLAGHALNMIHASQVSFAINVQALPVLPGAWHFLADGFLTKAHKSNQLYVQDHWVVDGLTEQQRLLLADPQTSGGLLLSVRADQAAEVMSALRPHFPDLSRVGEVMLENSPRLVFRA